MINYLICLIINYEICQRSSTRILAELFRYLSLHVLRLWHKIVADFLINYLSVYFRVLRYFWLTSGTYTWTLYISGLCRTWSAQSFRNCLTDVFDVRNKAVIKLASSNEFEFEIDFNNWKKNPIKQLSK